MTEQLVPQRGWYPNPVGSSADERFWNGTNWTVRVRSIGSGEERHVPVPASAPSPPRPLKSARSTSQAAQPATRSRSTSTQPGLGLERPYGQVRRVLYGSWWTFVAAILVLGGIASFANSIGTGLLGLALGALASRYAYRIWTWQARSLWFVIFF